MLKKLATVAVAVMLAGTAMAGPWEDGVAAYKRGDYAAAHDLWRPLAERGDPRAQNNLGVLYEKGLGIIADPETAAAWYRKATRSAPTPDAVADMTEPEDLLYKPQPDHRGIEEYSWAMRLSRDERLACGRGASARAIEMR
jgi:hypothetical protein